MNKRGKAWPFFVVGILIIAFSLTAIFGVSYQYGDTKHTYIKSASDIRFGIDIRGGVEAVDRIASAPLPYAVSQQPSLAARGLRVCFVKRYVMLYSYDVDRPVTIHRVFSTLRDYAAIIEHEA